jgi:hypothetical protein
MAKDRANAVLAGNKDMGTAIDTSSGVTVSVSCPTHNGVSCTTASTNYDVTVSIQRTESTIFAAVLNVSGVADSVTSVAETGTNANGMSCLKPWFIPNTVADQTDDPCTANTLGNVLVSNNQATQFAVNSYGAAMTIKAQNPASALSPGQFFELDVSQYTTNGGAKSYTDAIAGCNPYQFMCQSSYAVLSGNKQGPTAQGVCSLISGDSKCKGSADTYVSTGQYQWASDGLTHDTSKSVVYAPIVDVSAVSGFCPTNNLPSNANVPVVGYAQVFLQSANTGKDDISVYILNVLPCGPNSGTDTSNTGTPLPLRLVRTQ